MSSQTATLIANKTSGLVRGTEVDEMNGMLRGLSRAYARLWLKRDYTKMVEAKADALYAITTDCGRT